MALFRISLNNAKLKKNPLTAQKAFVYRSLREVNNVINIIAELNI